MNRGCIHLIIPTLLSRAMPPALRTMPSMCSFMPGTRSSAPGECV